MTAADAGVTVAAGRDAAALRRILESLPDWFGDPEAVDHYERAADDPALTALQARAGGEVAGVALVRRRFPETAELQLLAVAPQHHRAGIGTALLKRVVTDLEADGCRFLTVHTVGPSFDSAPYARTRAFYRAAGFHPLEEHTGLDWYGPTLILIRVLTPVDASAPATGGRGGPPRRGSRSAPRPLPR